MVSIEPGEWRKDNGSSEKTSKTEESRVEMARVEEDEFESIFAIRSVREGIGTEREREREREKKREISDPGMPGKGREV